MSWFGIVIERGPEGENWSAFCPDVGGVCCTTGNSLEEIKQNMKEALECYYADEPAITIDGVYELRPEEVEQKTRMRKSIRVL
ncbi:MAG: type II toxin-antitoxin system HicB family antitoxin [bacterium]|jgi:predicted RNase H-like HicB family nuclease